MPEAPQEQQRPARTWSPATFAAGAAGGVVFAALVAALLWPGDPEPGPGASRDGAAVAAQASPGSPSTTDSGDDDEEEEEDEEDDEDDEPSQAPLVADAAPAGEGPLPDSSPVSCPAATTTVSTADELTDALGSAAPGETIELADGSYEGEFTTTVSGTAEQPIFLCGSAEAVLQGGDVEEGGYTFHLDGASYWRLVGFTVVGGQKGVMADTTVGSVIQGLTVTGTGDEAIHLRVDSTDNVVAANTIHDTGLRNEKYGEGIYLGSAVSNWCTYTDCEADRSDRNVVRGNTIYDTTSEAIDIKEGTTGGLVIDNTFDGGSLVGADSWVDVKGNNYLIQGNEGTDSLEDGYQTHQILDGWGDSNVFAANTATDVGPGHAISSQPAESNVVLCDNTFDGADEGLSNITCS